MKHTVREISLDNGAKGVLVHVPDAPVMSFQIDFRAGEYLVDRDIIMVAKDTKAANNKLLEISDKLDEFLDHTDEDEDLIEISKYQVLLNQLFQKINPESE